ncbi:hypothetical protein ANAEL_04864 [Anaerolineales bacterium]|nr:hypothetical protein ANAEL_04864 [Anaerolineales bacterium]
MRKQQVMIAIDTNVLVRILVDAPGASAQMESARALLADSAVLYVSQIVQVETGVARFSFGLMGRLFSS